MVFEKMTGLLVGTLDFAFGPLLTTFGPALSLFLISSFITILVIVFNRIVTDREIVSELKEKMEDIREQLTSAQKSGNKDETARFLNEMMDLNTQYMKQMYKTLFVSLIVITIFLPWVKYSYSGMAVAKLPFNAPVIGSNLNWMVWYILVSFTIGWVVRKIFALD